MRLTVTGNIKKHKRFTMADLCAETNAVLKLELGENGGTRRIAIKKLWDTSTSTVSYQRLVSMALKYQSITSDIPPEEYHVAVTYTDEDGDCITISTDDELAEAFEQYVDKVPPILRAHASVKHVGNTTTNNRQKVNKKKKDYLKNLRQAVSEMDETARNASSKPKAEHMQNALESFVTILGQAVDSLAKNVEHLQKKNSAKGPSCPSSSTTNSADSSAMKKDKGVTAATQTTTTSRKVPRDCPPSPIRTESERKVLAGKLMKEAIDVVNARKEAAESEHDQKAPPTSTKNNNNTGTQKENEESIKSNILPVPACFDRNFIHGRHTCDGCLVTPIVGIRYHALNLPDHDLCDKCIGNYKGREIIMEPAQLERDRYMQPKWKRRQTRLHRQREMRCTRNVRCPGSAAAADASSDSKSTFDLELEMAIRRSIKDAVKAADETVEKKATVAATEKKEQKSSDVKVEEKKKPETKETSTPIAQKVTVDPPVEETVVEEVKTAPVVSSTETHVEDEEKVPVATLVTGDADTNEEVAPESTPKEAMVVEDEKSPDPPTEEPLKDDTSTSPKEDEEEQDDAKSCVSPPTADIVEEDKDQKAVDTSTDSTFAEDAAGQGEVAIAIGHALDEYADAISAVVSEVQKPDTIQIVGSSDSASNDPEMGCTILEGESSSKSEGSGNVIVEDASNASSKDDWQLLDEDGEVSSDEMIAQAAQILGSALFQSDISENQEPATTTTDNNNPSSKMEESDLTGESAFSKEENSISKSTISSVPTDVSSIFATHDIHPVALSRWQNELHELHTMGFLDDHRSIEALEYLEAANIGVESNDPVTVEQVVNFLLA